MEERRPSANPFLLTLLTVLLLGGLSLLKIDDSVLGLPLRRVNLLADVLRPERPRLADVATSAPPPPAAGAQPSDSARLANNLGDAAVPPEADSADAAAAQASVKAPSVPNLPGLESFLAALRETKASGKKTRIAYFGDSMIEGDFITGDLRDQLQKAFGGEGVGFVPITSVTADFRETIHQSFSANWRKYDLVSKQLPAAHPLGMAGHVFVAPPPRPATDSTAATESAWVQFSAGSQFTYMRRFPQMRLLYGPGNARDQVYATFGTQAQTAALDGREVLNELTFTAAPAARKLRLRFDCQAPHNVYGVSFEGPQGIVLDNFAFRGNSGMSLTRIPRNMLTAFGNLQDYRLIILQYGVNVANASVRDYTFYERAMTRVVDRLQKACPQASILIIGMSDKGYRSEGEYITDPSVPRLLAAQRRLAERNHVAFWNLFEAMGGENSMVGWVENKPAMANKDYTHVNARGARKIGQLLSQYLLQEYQKSAGSPAAPAAPTTDSASAAQTSAR